MQFIFSSFQVLKYSAEGVWLLSFDSVFYRNILCSAALWTAIRSPEDIADIASTLASWCVTSVENKSQLTQMPGKDLWVETEIQ